MSLSCTNPQSFNDAHMVLETFNHPADIWTDNLLAKKQQFYPLRMLET